MSKNELSLIGSPSLPVETKLTKSEVIELIIESMSSELKAQEHALEEELKTICNFPLSEVAALLTSATVNIRESWNDKSKIQLSLSAELKNVGALTARVGRMHAVQAELQRIRTVRNELEGNKQRAKNEILKRFLEQTDEGRTVLEQINSFKLKLQTKLLAAAK
jgi:hypothetical protein